MKKEQDKPLFDVRQLGRVKMYEAAKGVDWLSLFPEESGAEPAKLIDLPLVPEPPVAPRPEPLLPRQMPPPMPAPTETESIAPPERRSVAVLYPPGRARTPRAAIAASITTVVGTVAFLYWLVSPPVVKTSAALSEPQTAVHADRLTMDALRPAEEPAPSPGLSAPAPSTLPEPTQAPAAAATRPNARATELARSRTASTAAAPKPEPKKPTPTPTPRATPAIVARATPTPPPRQIPLAVATSPALSMQPTMVSPPPATSPSPSPSPSPLSPPPPPPAAVTAPASRPAATPQPSSTPLPTPSPTAAAPAPAASAAATGAAEQAAVRAVLDRYRSAFESLRSESVQAVWPGANTRALAKAFEQLQSQSMDFYSCGIELAAAGAEATCTGSVTFVPKVGGKTPRVENRSWTFYLKRQNDRWMIDRVVAK